jgi:hypothetical protein
MNRYLSIKQLGSMPKISDGVLYAAQALLAEWAVTRPKALVGMDRISFKGMAGDSSRKPAG